MFKEKNKDMRCLRLLTLTEIQTRKKQVPLYLNNLEFFYLTGISITALLSLNDENNFFVLFNEFYKFSNVKLVQSQLKYMKKL